MLSGFGQRVTEGVLDVNAGPRRGEWVAVLPPDTSLKASSLKAVDFQISSPKALDVQISPRALDCQIFKVPAPRL